LLSGFSTATTAEQMQSGIRQFVTTYNSTVAASSKVSGDSTGLHGADGIGRDLKRAINTDITLADTLRKWGVSVQSNGELAFDDQKFYARQSADDKGAAVFQKLGQAIDKVTTNELASNGAVGRSVTSLNKRVDVLKAQQNSLIEALQVNTDTSADSKTSASDRAVDAAKSQQNSLFDILQEQTSKEMDAGAQTRSAALETYLSISKQ
jgi:hypothetical protein